ncbi:MAG: AzlC family ABC transporter permease [Clostridiales bacterium]|nr:AzlC family ABC transporter permease [Clostridiales bacterium]
MHARSGYRTAIKEGLISGFPVVLGYFPVAIAFGLLSKNTGVSFWDTVLFSVLVFAGASQFMALDLIKAGAATGNIILATFLLNLRHFMMSASLSIKMKEIRKHWLIFIAFGVTDETFSVTSFTDKKLRVPFLLTLHGVSHASWILGTATGFLAGSILPLSLQSSLGVALYALFTALLVPEFKKSRPAVVLSIISGTIYALVSWSGLVPSSWSLITAIVAASLIGAFIFKDDAGTFKTSTDKGTEVSEG